ncbi:MAG: DinB family protein [Phycisphaerae bacterium]|nr:DinB family protein [Phycisphaerales bacterium]
MNIPELLCDQVRRTREWTELLVADLSGDDWTYQPAPGMAHALWLCGHLASAQNLLLFVRCLDTNALDPEFMAHFPIGSPIKSATEYNWPTPDAVLAKMKDVQAKVEEAILGIDVSILGEPAYGKDGAKHPHYDTKAGAISHMNRHEAFHAGQLASIRRLLGKPFLR